MSLTIYLLSQFQYNCIIQFLHSHIIRRRPSRTSDWSTYQRYGMPRTYHDSANFFPSQNKIAYNLPPLNFPENQHMHKTTVEMTTRRTNLSPPKKPEKLLQSLPSPELKTNFRIFHAIQLSKDKFHIRQVYPIETNSNQGLLNANGFATATSITSADRSIPALQQSEASSGGATLTLEPSSKAIAGNGGIAISSPVSRAILRKNMGTRILYRPESVAVAGVGGTAHAQSDLILDYVE